MFDCCFYGDTFHTSGVLQGAPPNATVVIEYVGPTRTFADDVVTDASGNFTDSWTVPANQVDTTWSVVADYFGDSTHASTRSDPYYVTVQPAPG